uniref:Uncharacterized protein n=1 Tax=Anguilla anguilla TaxID=7936 RepID=A0A0E9QFZ4_ANGAN
MRGHCSTLTQLQAITPSQRQTQNGNNKSFLRHKP